MFFTGGTILLLLLIAGAILILVFKPFSATAKSVKNESSSKSAVSPSSAKQGSASSSAESSSSASSTSSSSSGSSEEKISASASDWQLVLVNLKNPKPEMNPDLAVINNIYVDARIAQNVQEFLSAAQTVNPYVHLISGYRSVAYQSDLFNGYIQQTMNENPGWTEAEAKALVMKTSQPPESSEHETGLAIDMSAVDELDAEDTATADAIAAMAPDYGFILRFPKWGTASTGIDYEDWHFRYVGAENAKYITEHQLTLEDFVAQLSE
ncbi:M15 family metallopeptidase [Lactovum odontotermitis]